MVDGCVTGVLALALAMASGGAWATFRRQLIDVLMTVHVVDGAAPRDLAMTRRIALFGICLQKKSEVAIQRRAQLNEDINSDISSNRITWYSLGGATEQQKKAWARRVAKNLMPSRILKFSRTRWLGSLDSITSCALVSNAWNLLPRVVTRWKDAMEGRCPGPAEAAEATPLPKSLRYQ